MLALQPLYNLFYLLFYLFQQQIIKNNRPFRRIWTLNSHRKKYGDVSLAAITKMTQCQ